MSTFQPEKPVPDLPPARSSSSRGVVIVLLGCSGLALVIVLACGGLAYVGMRWGMEHLNTFAKEFEDQGYERRMGQVIQVNEPLAEKTVFVCQVLTIESDVEFDIAAACQVAEVKADIRGDVDFLGQVMKVHPGCVIDGDLRVRGAQVVEINGEVKGRITGSYGVLQYHDKTYPSGQSPSTSSLPAEMPPEARAAPPPPEAPSTPPPAEPRLE